MVTPKDWIEYKLLDANIGEKLEIWGNITLKRPDSQVIWQHNEKHKSWDMPDAVYLRSSTGGGNWKFNRTFKQRWNIAYKDLLFIVEPTGFKHTGLFPEQAINWEWMKSTLKKQKSYKILNLFAYTGAASIFLSSLGCDVVHVDSSKGINQWAKENYELNKDNNKTKNWGIIRFISDDVRKFVQREIRRGNKYDGIIMDPPVYGRGPNGELWELEREINSLVRDCSKLLSDQSSFFILNCYTSSLSHISMRNLLVSSIKQKGLFTSDEIGLDIKNSSLILPCGNFARWQSN